MAILAQGLPEVADVLECSVEEIDDLKLGPESLVLVRVPRGAVVPANLDARPVRLGLIQHHDDERWPEVSWDELEVKSAVLAWLRTSMQRPEHPLVGIAVHDLPLDTLAAATSAPIELVELVEASVAFAFRRHTRHEPIDWHECCRWAVGRRLSNRLSAVAPALRAQIYDAIAGSHDGHLRTLVHARESAELARVGLALRDAGDAMLMPLARAAHELQVFDILELEGARGEPVVHHERRRATTPSEAIHALDPRLVIGPHDPWFVDLREHVPEVAEFGRKLRMHLEGRERPARLAIVEQPGAGAPTMLRRMLADLSAFGFATFTAAVPSRASLGFAELLLAIMAGILRGCDADQRFSLPEPLLVDARAFLAEHALEGALRDYVSLGAGILEQVRPPALIELIRRLTNLLASTSAGAEGLRDRLEARSGELIGLIARMVDALQQTTSVRDLRVCVYIEGSEHWSAEQVDALLVSRVEALAELPCRIAFGLSLAAALFPVGRRPSEVFDTLEYLALPEFTTENVLHAVLGHRSDLDAVFANSADGVAWLARNSGGNLRHALVLVRLACERGTEKMVTQDDLERAGNAWVLDRYEGLRVGAPMVMVRMISEQTLIDVPIARELVQRELWMPRWPTAQFSLIPLLAQHSDFKDIMSAVFTLQIVNRIARSQKTVLPETELEICEWAIEDLQRLLDNHPDLWMLQARRAKLLRSLGRVEEADRTREAVIDALTGREVPNFVPADVASELAALLLESGKHEDALSWSARAWAVAHAASSPTDLIAVGTKHIQCLLALGRNEVAEAVRREVEAALALLPPDSPMTAAARERLAQAWAQARDSD